MCQRWNLIYKKSFFGSLILLFSAFHGLSGMWKSSSGPDYPRKLPVILVGKANPSMTGPTVKGKLSAQWGAFHGHAKKCGYLCSSTLRDGLPVLVGGNKTTIGKTDAIEINPKGILGDFLVVVWGNFISQDYKNYTSIIQVDVEAPSGERKKIYIEGKPQEDPATMAAKFKPVFPGVTDNQPEQSNLPPLPFSTTQTFGRPHQTNPYQQSREKVDWAEFDLSKLDQSQPTQRNKDNLRIDVGNKTGIFQPANSSSSNEPPSSITIILVGKAKNDRVSPFLRGKVTGWWGDFQGDQTRKAYFCGVHYNHFPILVWGKKITHNKERALETNPNAPRRDFPVVVWGSFISASPHNGTAVVQIQVEVPSEKNSHFFTHKQLFVLGRPLAQLPTPQKRPQAQDAHLPGAAYQPSNALVPWQNVTGPSQQKVRIKKHRFANKTEFIAPLIIQGQRKHLQLYYNTTGREPGSLEDIGIWHSAVSGMIKKILLAQKQIREYVSTLPPPEQSTAEQKETLRQWITELAWTERRLEMIKLAQEVNDKRRAMHLKNKRRRNQPDDLDDDLDKLLGGNFLDDNDGSPRV